MGNKGQISGVLSIVSGALALLGACIMFFILALVPAAIQTAIENDSYYSGMNTQYVTNFVNVMFGTSGVILAVFGILSIIGGVYAIKRKYWGLGLAAAIVSIFTFFPCGLAATILIAIGKSEFDRPAAVQTTLQPPTSQA